MRLMLIFSVLLMFNTALAQKLTAIDTLRYSEFLQKRYSGSKDIDSSISFARLARAMKQKLLADSIACEYIDAHLSKEDDSEILSKNNIKFLSEFFKGDNERIVRLILSNSDYIDSLCNKKGYSKQLVEYWITSGIIENDFLKKINKFKTSDQEPNWSLIQSTIKGKYGRKLAQSTTINAKIRWYTYYSDSTAIQKSIIEKYRILGIDTSWSERVALNNNCYFFIFLKSKDKKLLIEAASWIKKVWQQEGNTASFVDTYANLLYKAGQTKEAISEERRAISLAPNDLDIKRNYEKMLLGKPTW